LLTYLLTYSPTHLLKHSLTHPYSLTLTYLLAHSLAHLLIVIYAHFEELLLLDSTIASKLLKFNELISYKVKILVISRVGSRYRDAAGSARGRSGNYHLNCMQEQVIFHPYTLQQLENIIISRARIEAETEEIKPLLLEIFSHVTKEALIHLTLRTRSLTSYSLTHSLTHSLTQAYNCVV
jgi:hypothetical protein